VATATPATIKAYDVVLKQKPELTDRTSYVIDRKGRIVMVHSELDWKDHVAKTLAAVRALKQLARFPGLHHDFGGLRWLTISSANPERRISRRLEIDARVVGAVNEAAEFRHFSGGYPYRKLTN
jgi:hypothetical protein